MGRPRHNKNRKIWSRKETLGLFKCYAVRKNEFLNFKNKELAYENVLKDMISQNFTHSGTSVTAIVDKIRKFYMEYKWAKSTNGQSPYMLELEELFGDKPIVTTANIRRAGRNPMEVVEDINLEDASHSEGGISDTQSSSQPTEKERTESDKSKKRKYWSRKETLGLIKCYAARRYEFLHCRKKKTAYANVLKDMISQNFTDSSTTVIAVEDKMYKLRNAYRLAKNDNSKTPYMSELEKLFGDVASVATTHTLHIGRGPTKFLNDLKHELPQTDEVHNFEEGTSVIPSSSQSLSLAGNGKEKPGNNRRKRKVWSKEETLGLIKCYAIRRNEFLHCRKKKFAYVNVLKDMISQNLTDSKTSVDALAYKMYTLFNAYRSAKNTNKQAPYMSELEELFSDKPTAANVHIVEGPTKFLNDFKHKLPHFEEVYCSEEEASIVAASTRSTSSTFTLTSRSRQSYNDKKVELIRDEMHAKLAQREQFFEEMKAVFEERFRKDDEQRKEEQQKRFELLEKFLEKALIKKEPIDIELIKTECN